MVFIADEMFELASKYSSNPEVLKEEAKLSYFKAKMFINEINKYADFYNKAKFLWTNNEEMFLKWESEVLELWSWGTDIVKININDIYILSIQSGGYNRLINNNWNFEWLDINTLILDIEKSEEIILKLEEVIWNLAMYSKIKEMDNIDIIWKIDEKIEYNLRNEKAKRYIESKQQESDVVRKLIDKILNK